MATLKQKLEFSKQNPSHPAVAPFLKGIASGQFDDLALEEGIDFSKVSSTFEKAQRKAAPISEKAARFLGGEKIAKGLGQTFAARKIRKIGEKEIAQAKDLQTQLLGRLEEAQEQGDEERIGRLKEALGASQEGLQKAADIQGGFAKDTVSNREVIGDAISLATLALGAKATGAAARVGGRVAKGAALAGVGAAEGVGFATGRALSEEERLPTAKELAGGAALGAVGGAVLPGAAKLAGKGLGFVTKKGGNVIKRLLKGLGAPVEEIAENPQAIDAALKKLKGADKQLLADTLRKETDTFIKGANTIKKEAGDAFGEGLERLGKVDIPKETVGTNLRSIIDDAGVDIESLTAGGSLDDIFKNVDFAGNNQSMKKAKGAIDLIEGETEFTGSSLRELFKKIDNLKFKNVGDDVIRQDTNQFLKELSDNLKSTISESSDEFGKINTAFSGEVQLADDIQSTLGKMKFRGKNLTEIRKASERIKTLVDKSGLGEENVDRFLRRLGIDPSTFRAETAVRRVVDEPLRPEGAGFSPFEIVRQLTAGIIDPTDATRAASFIEKLPKLRQNKVIDLIRNTPVESRAFLVKSLNDIFGGE